MVAVVIPVVMVQLRLFFLDAFEILLGDGFEKLLVVRSTATLCNFLQTIDRILKTSNSIFELLQPYILSICSSVLELSTNQSLLGAMDNKIFFPTSNFFFFNNGIIFLSETLGARVDSTIMIGGFLALRFIFEIFLKSIENSLLCLYKPPTYPILQLHPQVDTS